MTTPLIEIDANGNKRWRLPNGDLHRLDGPAIEYIDGSTRWYVNGELHRLDGPAVDIVGGYKSWYIYGEQYNFLDFIKNVKPYVSDETYLILTLTYGDSK